MNAPATNLPAERAAVPPIVKLGAQLEQRASEFKKALPSHISPDKLQRTIITAAQNSPDLLTADRQSLIVAAMKAAQDGLLPDGREAALVIFNTREKDAQGNWFSVKTVAYMPMVYGLRKKIVQSGEVVSLQTGLVYRAEMEGGHFLYEIGIDPPIRHRPKLDLTTEESADTEIVAAYSIARMKDGSWSVEVMRRSEIDKVREASQTGATRDRKGQARQPKGPWVDWFGEMARKTVMRRHSKTLPMTGDMIVDVEGREHESAESAVRVLSIEPDARVALPGNADLDAQEEGSAEGHDPDTGEVRDSRGMTEVSEETARAVDEGQTDEFKKDFGIEGGGSVYEDITGEPIPPVVGVDEAAPIDPHYGKPYADKRREVLEALALAASHDDLLAAQAIAARHQKALPADVKAEINAAYAEALERHPAPQKAEPAAEAATEEQEQEQEQSPAAAAKSPTEQAVTEIRGGIKNAKNLQYLAAVDDKYVKARAGLPDEVVAELDAAIDAKRKALREAGK